MSRIILSIRWLLLLLCLMVSAMAAMADWEHSPFSLRQRSMGGCIAAGSCWYDTPIGNPAALRRPVRKVTWELSMDPLAPLLWNSIESSGDENYAGILPSAAFLGRAGWAGRHFSFMLQLAGNGALDQNDLTERAFSSQDMPSSRLMPSLTMGFALDSKVSLGISLFGIYDEESGQREPGMIYGVQIRANRVMDVGAVALSMPGGLDPFRRMDRLSDRTINVGIQFYPLGRPESRKGSLLLDPRLLLDVRNVTQEESLASSQELHLGALLGLAGMAELRGGIFFPTPEAGLSSRPRLSAGLGLSQPFLREQRATGTQGPWVLELGWMQDPEGLGNSVWMLRTGWVIRR